MGYTKQERLAIGKRIYHNEISRKEAAEQYGISMETARVYMRLYRDVNQLPPKNQTRTVGEITKISMHTPASSLSGYESMTREELIRELVKARINEARLKKGYEVKGVGAEKRFVPFGNRNTK